MPEECQVVKILFHAKEDPLESDICPSGHGTEDNKIGVLTTSFDQEEVGAFLYQPNEKSPMSIKNHDIDPTHRKTCLGPQVPVGSPKACARGKDQLSRSGSRPRAVTGRS